MPAGPLPLDAFSLLGEVMDKVPDLLQIWFLGLFLGFVGCYTWQFSRLLGSVVSLLGSLSAWALLMDVHSLRKYIEAEAGGGYIPQCYAAICTGVALHVLGMVLGKRARTRREPGLSEQEHRPDARGRAAL
jgi:hypothetical protein